MLLKTKISTITSLLTLAIASQAYAATIHNANTLTNIKTMTRSGHSMLSINGQTIDLRTKVEHTLPSGQKKIKLTQYYNDIEVENYAVVADVNKRGVKSNLSGFVVTELANDLSGKQGIISKNQALDIALSKGSRKGQRKGSVSNKNITLKIQIDTTGKARYVYEVNYLIVSGTPSRPFVRIDATTGVILKKWNGLTMELIGTGPGGNIKTGKHYYGAGDRRKLDVTVNGDECQLLTDTVMTVDRKHQASSPNIPFKFACPENTHKEINGAYSPLNDGHYYGGVAVNMYKEWFNTSPVPGMLYIHVHSEENYQNAYWDGERLVFGDGGSVLYPLTTRNIVAHEAGHAFTENNSNLVYENQSGGMNEAFSDIAAEATEFFETGTVDWLTGADVIKADGAAMRYFDDPTRDQRSIGHIDDYYDDLDVHLSSGIYNKAYYTLANIEGWDPKKAFEPFLIANKLYWDMNSLMYQGACGIKKAAKDLNYSEADVVTAFAAVGITPCEIPPEPVPPAAIELTNGETKIISGEEYSSTYYQITVPEGTNNLNFAAFDTDGSTGNITLYIRKDYTPSKQKFDCLSWEHGNNDRNCKITDVPRMAGVWYVMIYSRTNYDKVGLLATYSESENIAPVAKLTWVPDKLNVTFSSQSTDNDGWISKILWDFGDGSTVEGDNIEHLFASAGTYQVTMTAIDNKNASSSLTQSITVSTNNSGTLTIKRAHKSRHNTVRVALSYSDFDAKKVKIYRDNKLIVHIKNRGKYRDRITNTEQTTFKYHLCVKNNRCSNSVIANFE